MLCLVITRLQSLNFHHYQEDFLNRRHVQLSHSFTHHHVFPWSRDVFLWQLSVFALHVAVEREECAVLSCAFSWQTKIFFRWTLIVGKRREEMLQLMSCFVQSESK